MPLMLNARHVKILPSSDGNGANYRSCTGQGATYGTILAKTIHNNFAKKTGVKIMFLRMTGLVILQSSGKTNPETGNLF